LRFSSSQASWVAWCSKGKKLSEVQVNPFTLRFVLRVKKAKKEQDHQTRPCVESKQKAKQKNLAIKLLCPWKLR
jgi:hypothetical protein